MKDPLYLVTFCGIPDWEEGQTTHVYTRRYLTRRYLFSKMEKAVAFVKRRTSSPEWMTHPAYHDRPMAFRLKRGSSNRYTIVTVYVDDVYDEDLSNDSVQQSKS